jgi:hypothetical protein
MRSEGTLFLLRVLMLGRLAFAPSQWEVSGAGRMVQGRPDLVALAHVLLVARSNLLSHCQSLPSPAEKRRSPLGRAVLLPCLIAFSGSNGSPIHAPDLMG